MTAYPLPRLGLCPVCEGEIRIRKAGALYVHGCAGDGREPAAVLRPTFARWLHAQAGHGVDHDDRVSELAHRMFVGCGHRYTPVDMLWATADELHEEIHRVTPVRQSYNGQRCDWLCRDIEHAGRVYARLLAAETTTGGAP